MAKLNILLYSTERTQRLRYEDADGIMTSEIEETFMHCNCTGHYSKEWVRIEVSQSTREALKRLEAKYDDATDKHIRKLYGFIAKLKDGSHFYYFNEDHTTVVARRTALACLEAEKAGNLGYHRVHNDVFGYYSRFNILFEYLSFGFDGLEHWVGEENMAERICRFCGRRFPEVEFGNAAHAVQEALGNKLIFCHEECNDCNNRLAPIEDNFRKLMDFRRVMYHIPRKKKGKTPQILGKNFIIPPVGDGSPRLYLMEEELPKDVDKSKPFMYRLELKPTMTNEKMYKALCKMVIDVLPASELSHFRNTTRWINSDCDLVPDALPSLLYVVLPAETIFFKQPLLDVFINNRGHGEQSPYCTAILWIYDIAYMFCLPLTDIDAGRFKYDADLHEHWQVMSDLIGIKHWEKQDSSTFTPCAPWVMWNIDLSTPDMIVLPKSDPVFQQCLQLPIEVLDAGLPEYHDAGLTIHGVPEAEFMVVFNDAVSDSMLRDVSTRIAGPEFAVFPAQKQVRVTMYVEAYDTTDSIEYFRFHFSVVVNVACFDKYVSIVEDEKGRSFAFHYGLRDHIFVFTLAAAERKMKYQRRGTPFRGCSLDKLLRSRRLFKVAYYLVPFSEGIYKINDTQRHNDSRL